MSKTEIMSRYQGTSIVFSDIPGRASTISEEMFLFPNSESISINKKQLIFVVIFWRCILGQSARERPQLRTSLGRMQKSYWPKRGAIENVLSIKVLKVFYVWQTLLVLGEVKLQGSFCCMEGKWEPSFTFSEIITCRPYRDSLCQPIGRNVVHKGSFSLTCTHGEIEVSDFFGTVNFGDYKSRKYRFPL